jgi:hypothetical protein
MRLEEAADRLGDLLMAALANDQAVVRMRPERLVLGVEPRRHALGQGLGDGPIEARADDQARDLRERAMLGDGGANLLGFTVGMGLFLVLPGWAIVLAAGFAVAGNVLAETVTLSTVIARVPPLRWVDGLGRLPDVGN